MKSFIALTLLAASLFASAGAHADPLVCIKQDISENTDTPRLEVVNFQCNTMKRVEAGIELVSITAEAGSLYAACSGIGAEVSVLLQGGAIGLHAIKFAVSQLPCDKETPAKKIDAEVRQLVREELMDAGVTCH